MAVGGHSLFMSSFDVVFVCACTWKSFLRVCKYTFRSRRVPSVILLSSLDAWTLVHSEARRLGSETVPGNRVPAPLGPPDRRARRKELEDSHRPLKGEQVPAVCLFDDVHEMCEERRLVWQPPQNCPSKLVEDKVRAVKPRNDGAGVEEKLKRKPRPTIDVKSLRNLEMACFRRSVTLEEHASSHSTTCRRC